MYDKLFFLFVLSFVCLANANTEKISVTVYYESLCPDSIKFFTTQLYPTSQTNLSKWLNLTLVPYGKSNQTELAGDQWQFSCHHGPYECKGNKIQACALQKIEASSPRPPNFGFNPTTLGFINCLMDKTEKKADPSGGDQYTFPTEKCANINKVPNYVDIENCVEHTSGSKYLVELGLKTQNFSNPLKSVPTIVINDKYKAEESEEAKSNLVKVLCRHITKDKPDECKSCAATVAASLLVFTLMFVKSIF